MDSSQQALQTNGKFFTNFKFVFKLLPENLNIVQNKVKDIAFSL